MACFLAPAAAAIITTGINKKIAPKYHPEWLSAMLWGGVIMLIVDHAANGEIALRPPFLTVAPREIITVGGAMTATIIAAWAILVLIANKAEGARKKKIQTISI